MKDPKPDPLPCRYCNKPVPVWRCRDVHWVRNYLHDDCVLPYYAGVNAQKLADQIDADIEKWWRAQA